MDNQKIKPGDKIHSFNGEDLTLRQIYDKYKTARRVSYSVFCSRVGDGWEIQRALTRNLPLSKQQLYHFNGEYLTLRRIYDKNNPKITYKQFFNRVVGLKWKIKHALSVPLKEWEGSRLTNQSINHENNN